jgi:hypothetical protein
MTLAENFFLKFLKYLLLIFNEGKSNLRKKIFFKIFYFSTNIKMSCEYLVSFILFWGIEISAAELLGKGSSASLIFLLGSLGAELRDG